MSLDSGAIIHTDFQDISSLNVDQTYLNGLIKERDQLGSNSTLDLTKKLIEQEIERIQKDGKTNKPDESKMADVTKDKAIKLTVKVVVPVKEHPKFNFVGKLLGPKGNSLKRLQEETLTKMAILGRGSVRDKQKEEEMRLSGESRFSHLSEDLHVEVTSVAPPAEAHARMAYALTEIRRYLVPDYNDEIRQEQMREMQLLNKPEKSTEDGSKSEGNSDEETNNNDNCSPTQISVSQEQKVPSAAGIIKKKTSILNATGLTGSRRSVLSLLTKARSIQQKEQDILKVFPDISSGFNVFDPINELQSTEVAIENFNGGNGSVMKASQGNRVRFRFDPYAKLASST